MTANLKDTIFGRLHKRVHVIRVINTTFATDDKKILVDGCLNLE